MLYYVSWLMERFVDTGATFDSRVSEAVVQRQRRWYIKRGRRTATLTFSFMLLKPSALITAFSKKQVTLS